MFVFMFILLNKMFSLQNFFTNSYQLETSDKSIFIEKK